MIMAPVARGASSSEALFTPGTSGSNIGLVGGFGSLVPATLGAATILQMYDDPGFNFFIVTLTVTAAVAGSLAPNQGFFNGIRIKGITYDIKDAALSGAVPTITYTWAGKASLVNGVLTPFTIW